MKNNFNIIKPLLRWNSKDDFYFLQIIQRKKDAKVGVKVNGCNNNSRLIKAYYVKSLEHLEFIEPEVIELCSVFNARAGINLNKRSFEKTALQNLKLITDNFINGNYDKVYKTYSSAAGKFNHDNKKKWIIDIDEDEMPWKDHLLNIVEKCDPQEDTKFIVEVPSKTGVHLITSPFNIAQFKLLLDEKAKEYQITLNLDIQKNNPTNLYIP